MQSSILDRIMAHKVDEVAAARARLPLSRLEAGLDSAPPTRGFADALRARIGQRQAAVIAEIKKASPSRGLIRADFDPAAHARDYAAHGATCLSVLTDRDYFQGSGEDLRHARAACPLPLLRKDFIVDPYQIVESRWLGADCILLIVAGLQPSRLKNLAACATDFSLDVLVEVHNRQELEQALQLDCELIGINNRDLHTFQTRLDTTVELARHVPADKLVVTESGIDSSRHVRKMLGHGVYGFLVGESLMRAAQPGVRLRELFFDS